MNFDPEKSLFNLAATKLIFSVSFFLSVAVMLVIGLHSELYFYPTYNGINNAVEIFKVPLAILAIGLTLVGIIGANHRSEQTKKQIERTANQIDLSNRQMELTRSQNYFTNYYKHIEEFEKYCRHLDDSFSITSTRRLHSLVFPDSRNGKYQASTQLVAKFEYFVNRVIKMGHEMGTSDYGDYTESLSGVIRLRAIFMGDLGLNDKSYSGAQLSVKEATVIVPEGTARGAFRYIVDLCKRVDEILQFDLEYITPDPVKKFIRIDLEAINAWPIGTKFEPIPMMEMLDGTAAKWISPRYSRS